MMLDATNPLSVAQNSERCVDPLRIANTTS